MHTHALELAGLFTAKSVHEVIVVAGSECELTWVELHRIEPHAEAPLGIH